MPTISTQTSEEEAKVIELAAGASEEKRISPYVLEAIRQRLAREGMLPGNVRAELLAAVEEMGVDRALEVLRRSARRKNPEAVAAR